MEKKYEQVAGEKMFEFALVQKVHVHQGSRVTLLNNSNVAKMQFCTLGNVELPTNPQIKNLRKWS